MRPFFDLRDSSDLVVAGVLALVAFDVFPWAEVFRRGSPRWPAHRARRQGDRWPGTRPPRRPRSACTQCADAPPVHEPGLVRMSLCGPTPVADRLRPPGSRLAAGQRGGRAHRRTTVVKGGAEPHLDPSSTAELRTSVLHGYALDPEVAMTARWPTKRLPSTTLGRASVGPSNPGAQVCRGGCVPPGDSPPHALTLVPYWPTVGRSGGSQ
jgi:hypothetical protein